MSNQTEHKESKSEFLSRYTDLPATIHLLETKSITLLNPATWDDRNDVFFLNQYKLQKKKAKSVLALCFSKTRDKYHHWKVFAGGVGGVRIDFDKELLLKDMKSDTKFKSGEVIYKNIKEVKQSEHPTCELPFLKRIQFEDDQEYRIIFVDKQHKDVRYKQVNIGLNCIWRITLSPWMPETIVQSVRKVLKKIDGCQGMEIFHSTLIDNQTWQKAGSADG